jgi:hypothetical protein
VRGSTRVARRAGTYAARSVTPIVARAAMTIGNGLPAGRFPSILAATRLLHMATGAPDDEANAVRASSEECR